MWAGALLLGALVVGRVLLLLPYTAGVSRQHASALSYWISAGCPADEGEAWSQEPVDLGSEARRSCRAGAVVRTVVAGTVVLTAGVVMVVVQLASLRVED